MWFGCRLPVAVVSQAYPWNAEICPGFPPPQTALRIILSNEGDAVYIDIDIDIYRYTDIDRHTGRLVTGEVDRWVCMLVGRLLVGR